MKQKKMTETQKLAATQRLEDRLAKAGWSGSGNNLKKMMKSHNAKFGTFFRTIEDVISYYRIKC